MEVLDSTYHPRIAAEIPEEQLAWYDVKRVLGENCVAGTVENRRNAGTSTREEIETLEPRHGWMPNGCRKYGIDMA